MANKKKQDFTLKIVCFGDSLTLGYQTPTPWDPCVDHIPYGTYLQEWLGARGEVLVRGICGETTQDMKMRFMHDVLRPQPHLVIIIGGTNDLGLRVSPVVVVENLQFFYEQAQANGIAPVAVTVPSVRDMFGQDVDASCQEPLSSSVKDAIRLRVTLNQALKEFCRERDIPIVDWFSATCESQSQQLSMNYSNDGLHLTTAGYHKLAEMIWAQVLDEGWPN